MNFEQAVLIFATQLIEKTSIYPYDKEVLRSTALAIAATTNDYSEAETLVRIARWESGGFRADVASCKVKGDHGLALGLFQVHAFDKNEARMLCSSDYREQATAALFHVRESLTRCSRQGMHGSDRLTGYTRGDCHAHDWPAYLRYGDGSMIEKLTHSNANNNSVKFKWKNSNE